MIGIYKITNLINGKCYIGQSVNVEGRLWNHQVMLKSKCHPNSHLQYSVNKYGFNNFKFELIEECQRDNLNQRERYWIQYYNSFNNGYNHTTGGEKESGWEHDKETKSKISEGRHNYIINNPDVRKKLIKHLNDIRPKEKSEESRKKFSENIKGKNNPFYGRTHSEESRKKISDSVRKAYAEGRIIHASGYKMSEDTKEKCRQRMIGNNYSKGKMNGRILINNGSISKQINPEDLQSYLDQGWIKGRIGKPKSNGRKGKIRISNGEKKKFILPEELLNYEAEGWFRG